MWHSIWFFSAAATPVTELSQVRSRDMYESASKTHPPLAAKCCAPWFCDTYVNRAGMSATCATLVKGQKQLLAGVILVAVAQSLMMVFPLILLLLARWRAWSPSTSKMTQASSRADVTGISGSTSSDDMSPEATIPIPLSQSTSKRRTDKNEGIFRESDVETAVTAITVSTRKSSNSASDIAAPNQVMVDMQVQEGVVTSAHSGNELASATEDEKTVNGSTPHADMAVPTLSRASVTVDMVHEPHSLSKLDKYVLTNEVEWLVLPHQDVAAILPGISVAADSGTSPGKTQPRNDAEVLLPDDVSFAVTPSTTQDGQKQQHTGAVLQDILVITRRQYQIQKDSNASRFQEEKARATGNSKATLAAADNTFLGARDISLSGNDAPNDDDDDEGRLPRDVSAADVQKAPSQQHEPPMAKTESARSFESDVQATVGGSADPPPYDSANYFSIHHHHDKTDIKAETWGSKS